MDLPEINEKYTYQYKGRVNDQKPIECEFSIKKEKKITFDWIEVLHYYPYVVKEENKEQKDFFEDQARKHHRNF